MLHRLAILVTLSLLLPAHSTRAQSAPAPPEPAEKVFEVVEVMPQFPGGTAELLKFVSRTIRYPARPLRYQITGKVAVRFVVDPQGRVREPVIMKSLTPECDSEVLRVVRLLPAFSPGLAKGRPVPVYFLLPVTFSLPDEAPAGWQPPAAFTEVLKRGGMEFRYPQGFVATPVIPNDQQFYQLALRHPKKRFEVRYAIRPLDSLVLKYRAFQQHHESGEEMMNPNDLHKQELKWVVLPNISGGLKAETNDFPPQAIGYELGADWGSLGFVPVGKEFGQNYKFCAVVAMHKADRSDAFIFMLVDRKEDFQELFDASFHALRYQR